MSQLKNMDEVLAEELKIIQDRRVYLKFGQLPDKPPTIAPDDARRRASEMGLTGLAFSGGGIRSATFALGVLQGLARLNLLSRFDYLSTVSGGGYLGSWLAAWIKREESLSNVERQLKPNRSEQAKAKRDLPGEKREFVPFTNKDSSSEQGFAPPYYKSGTVVDQEPEPINHIRSYSNYLTPKPGLASADTWALFAIYLRNFAINAMTILPATVMLVIAVRLIVSYFTLPAEVANLKFPEEQPYSTWTFWISVSGAVGMVFASVVSIVFGLNRVKKSRDEKGGPYKPKLGPRVGVVLPLFIAAIFFTWLFTINSAKAFEETKEDNSYFYMPFYILIKAIISKLPREGELHALEWLWVLGVQVAISAILALLAKFKDRDQEGKSAPAKRTLFFRFVLVNIGFLIFDVLFLLIFLNPPSWLGSDTQSTAIGLAGATAVLVGVYPFMANFEPTVRILRGLDEDKKWSLWDRIAYGVRIVLVPCLAGFNGGMFFYPIALASAELLKGQPCAIATFGPPLFIVAVVIAAISNVWLLGPCLKEDEREWWASLTGLLMQFALAWLLLFSILLYGVAGVIYLFGESRMLAGAFSAAWLAVSQGGAMSSQRECSGISSGSGAKGWVRKILIAIAPPIFLVGLLLIVSAIVGLLVNPSPVSVTGMTPAGQYLHAIQATASRPLWIWLGASSAALALALALVDVNMFSLNAMYANRLTRCYLGASRKKEAWKNFQDGEGSSRVKGGAPTGVDSSKEGVRSENSVTGFDLNDDIPLYDLHFGRKEDDKRNVGYEGPFPLINTALNLVAGEELALQDRKADSFVLSPLYCGSRSTGYRELPNPKDDPDPTLSLGLAVAISGAAVDPNMGSVNSLPQTMLMTVFNARLGRWLPNPADQARQSWRAQGPSPGSLLFREFFGLTRDDSDYVHLSDGGHFENLGVYELVRRRCRFIVACDAGQDGGFLFEDLAGLIRKCRTDFGVRIELDVSPIKPDPTSRSSRWHCAVGSIHYEDVDPKDAPGILVYIKASITGDEPPDVQNYATVNPSFPHESTADQFFDESQFESYRALGFHIASDVFFSAQGESDLPSKPLWDVRADVEQLKQEVEALKMQASSLLAHKENETLKRCIAFLDTIKNKNLDALMSPTLQECCSVVTGMLGNDAKSSSSPNYDSFVLGCATPVVSSSARHGNAL